MSLTRTVGRSRARSAIAALLIAGLAPLGQVSLPATAAPAVTPAAAPAQAEEPSPPLTMTPEQLATYLSCTGDLATNPKTPVLLVTGTVESVDSSWKWGYRKVLIEQGYPVCTVALPNRGVGDVQRATESAVYAVRTAYAQAGNRKVSIMGHSQGGTVIWSALRFYPDLASKVDDAISLASPYNEGITLGDVACGIDRCPPFAWQARPGSNLVKALTREPLPAGPSYTTVSSVNDEIVNPQRVTEIPGAANFAVQDLCPGRIVGHVMALADNVYYSYVMDALTHAGPASGTRVTSAACSRDRFPGIDVTLMDQILMSLPDLLEALFEAQWVDQEPALRLGAIGKVTDTNIALNKATHVSSVESYSTYYGSKAVDGNYSTRWASKYYQDPGWIAVDLGARKTINGVQVSWEDAYANDYQILVSDDGQNWTSAWSTGSGDGGHDWIPLNGVQGRYVAVYGTYRGSGYGGYSIWELTVAGH